MLSCLSSSRRRDGFVSRNELLQTKGVVSIGFCWNAEEMTAFVRYLDAHADPVEIPKGTLVAAISVHDVYLYAGKIYYPLYKMIRAKEVVIFGVTHGSVRRAMGPLSNVIILDEIDRRRGPMSGSLPRYSGTFREKVLPVQGTSMGLTAVFSNQHWCG